MSQSSTTVYFRGFPEDIEDEQLESLFSQCGSIIKFFIHNSRTYGMVEFDEASSCAEALNLNGKPPLNLYLNMAKNSSDRTNTSMNQSRGPAQPVQRNYNSNFEPASMTYVDEEVYVDENNYLIDVLIDPTTNEIYVPIRYAPNIRRINRKKPAIITNDGFTGNSIANDHDDDCSVNSAGSSRKVQYNHNSLEIQRDFVSGNENSRMKGPQKYHKNREFGNQTNNFSNSSNTSNHFNTDERKKFNRYKTGPNQSSGSGEENKSYSYKKFEAGLDKTQGRFSRRENDGTKSSGVNEGDWDMGSAEEKTSTKKPFFNKTVTKAETNVDKSPQNNIPSTSFHKTARTEIAPQKPSINEISSKSFNKNLLSNKSKTNKVSYKSIELPKNEFTKVRVETKISDTKGWVQICEKFDDFVEFSSKIIEAKILHPKPIKPEIGILCLAYFEENWFRAVVISTMPEVKVRFIDYGNESTVEQEILELSQELQDIPAYAICIHLATGAPCKLFDNMILNVKPVKIENDVVEVHVENGIYDVETPQPSKSSLKQNEVFKPSTASIKQNEISKPSTSFPKTKMNSTAQVDSLEACQNSMISKLETQMSGFFTATMKVSDTQGVAFFLPEQLAADAAVLETLSDSIEVDKKSSFKPKKGDLVAAINEGYNRAYILDINNGFKVAFIDYGVIKTVTEVQPLPSSFKTIPEFSCLFTSNCLNSIEVDAELCFKITKILNNVVHCTLNESLEITFVLWSPKDENSEATCFNSSSSTSSVETVKAVEKIIKPPELKLKSGDHVKIIDEDKGCIYLRTKEGADILKRVCEFMAKNAAKAPKIMQAPEVGDYVVAEFNDEWFRAVVTNVKKNGADILYIDYGNVDIMKPFFALKQLDEEMKKEPCAAIKAKLRDFTDKSFSEKGRAYLMKWANKILKVESVENGVDLTTKDGENIVDELIRLENQIPERMQSRRELYMRVEVPGESAPRITDLKLIPIPLGEGEVRFLCDVDYSEITICVCTSNPEILHQIHVELLTQMTKYAQHIAPKVPYVPEKGEIVLVQHMDKWYRAMCLEIDEETIIVFYVDYGFNSPTTADKTRKMPKEFIEEYKALGNFATIEGLPQTLTPEVIDRLGNLFVKNEVYKADVLSKDEEDDSYSIKFPHVIKKLKEDHLI